LDLGMAFAGLIGVWLGRLDRDSSEGLCQGRERRSTGEAEKRSHLVLELEDNHHSGTEAPEVEVEVGLEG
jgi:hypothetical protein